MDSARYSLESFGLYQKLLSFVLVSYTSFLCGVNYYAQVSLRFIIPDERD